MAHSHLQMGFRPLSCTQAELKPSQFTTLSLDPVQSNHVYMTFPSVPRSLSWWLSLSNILCSFLISLKCLWPACPTQPHPHYKFYKLSLHCVHKIPHHCPNFAKLHQRISVYLHKPSWSRRLSPNLYLWECKQFMRNMKKIWTAATEEEATLIGF